MKSSYEEFKKEWINDLGFDGLSSFNKGIQFSYKLFCQWLDIDSNSDLIICDGSNDGGIDIAYLKRNISEDDSDDSKDGDIWYIVQSKYGDSSKGTDTIRKEGDKLIKTLEGKNNSLNSNSEKVIEKLKGFRENAISKDKIVFIIATSDPLTKKEKEELDNIKILGKSKLGDFFDVDAISIETIYKRLSEKQESKNTQIKLQLKANLLKSDDSDELLIGAVTLFDLYEFLKKYKDITNDLDLLYEKNVRRYLGIKKKIAKGIKETIEKNPERFGLYNNGITVVVENFEFISRSKVTFKEDIIELDEPYIVNGCQTTKTIYEVLSNKIETGGTGVESESLKIFKEKLRKGIVVIKIVKVGTSGDSLLIDTTRYTNSQNSVSEKDFLALEDDFQKFKDQIAKKYNIFLETQRGGWDSQRALQKQNPTIKPYFSEYANAFDLIKIYASGWYGLAGIALKSNQPFAPGGSFFKKISEMNEFGIDDLYAAYSLREVSKKYNFGNYKDITRSQTRFLFFMILIEFLKDIMLFSKINTTEQNITTSLLKLINDTAFDSLVTRGVACIDNYMTEGNEFSVFTEPKNLGDLNAFLKLDNLGKTDEASPNLRTLLSNFKMNMGFKEGKEPTLKERIKEIIQN